MNDKFSGFLKVITGVVIINQDGTDILCSLEDMQYSKYFSIGQIFHAVRVLNGKSVSDYGALWPRYRVHPDGPVSNVWQPIQETYNQCTSDYDFLVEVCAQLNEDVPEVVQRSDIEKNLELFKQTILEVQARQAVQ